MIVVGSTVRVTQSTVDRWKAARFEPGAIALLSRRGVVTEIRSSPSGRWIYVHVQFDSRDDHWFDMTDLEEEP